RAERLDRGDRPALDVADRQHARPPRLAVDVHGARAALGDAAAELGAGEAELIAQDPEQRGVGVGVDRHRLAVGDEPRPTPNESPSRDVTPPSVLMSLNGRMPVTSRSTIALRRWSR